MPRFNPALYWGLMRTLNTSYPLVTKILRPEESKKLKYNYNSVGSSKSKLSLWRSEKLSPGTVETKEKDDMQYCVEIYVSNTSIKNGPGHVSCSLIKKSKAGAEVVMHTSYVPGTIGSLINGASLTNIPVPASNVPGIRDDDVNKADVIIQVAVTDVQFNRGIEKQIAIEKGVDEGSHFYTTVGPINVFACALTWMFGQHAGSEKMTENYFKDKGHYPDEDNTGNLIIEDSHHPEQHKSYVLLNCTAAIQAVLNAIGLGLKERFVLPASLGEGVLNECPKAKIVAKSLVAPTSEAQIENDETTELYRQSLDM